MVMIAFPLGPGLPPSLLLRDGRCGGFGWWMRVGAGVCGRVMGGEARRCCRLPWCGLVGCARDQPGQHALGLSPAASSTRLARFGAGCCCDIMALAPCCEKSMELGSSSIVAVAVAAFESLGGGERTQRAGGAMSVCPSERLQGDILNFFGVKSAYAEDQAVATFEILRIEMTWVRIPHLFSSFRKSNESTWLQPHGACPNHFFGLYAQRRRMPSRTTPIPHHLFCVIRSQASTHR